MNKNIVLCGVGGQGTVLASKLIAAAAMKKDIPVMSAETIGMAQRGGSVFSHIRMGEGLYAPMIAKGTADIIIGPMGIVIADSLLGEITPKMAVAIGQSEAKKVLIPVNRCQHFVVGCEDLPLGEYVKLVVEEVKKIKAGEC